jgi:hypothetical protein
MVGLVFCILGLGMGQAVAQTSDQIDWKRAQQIHQKFLRGEKLTDEEQAYHDRAAKALQASGERQSPPAKPPLGLKPLSDMTAEDRYKGQDGGLCFYCAGLGPFAADKVFQINADLP